MIDRIYAEVERHKDSVQEWEQRRGPEKDSVKNEVEYLRKMEKTISLRLNDARIKEIKREIKLVRGQVGKSRKALQRFLRIKREKLLGISRLGIWEELWPKQPFKYPGKRLIELDTTLQVQLGKILATFLRQSSVSLATLSRLIVLVYWVSDLARPWPGGEGVLRIRSTERKLTVKNVHDNLIEAELEKAKAFGKKDVTGKRVKSKNSGPSERDK